MDKPINTRLNNGLKICFLPNYGVDSVTIHLRGLCGSNYEKKNQVGAAHLLEHLNTSLGNKQNILLRGGKIIGVTSRDDVLYMVKLLKENLIDGLEYLSNIFSNKAFSNEEIERQKFLSIQEIKRVKSNPEKLLSRLCYKVLFPKQRLSKLNTGEEQDVIKLKEKDLYSFRDQRYKINNFVLVVCGSFDVNASLSYIRKYFENIPSGSITKHLKHHEIKEFKKQIFSFPVKQSYVKIDFYGYTISSSRKYPLSILSACIDLYLKNYLKEKLGLIYSVSCSSFNTGSYGLFIICFSTAKNSVDNIIKMIYEAINQAEKLITISNIEHIKHIVLANMCFAFEKTSSKADYYSELILHGRKYQNYIYEQNAIKKTTVGQITKVLNDIKKQKPKITIIGFDN